MEEGKFRHDLFFRLQILDIYVPSLREHMSDIPILVDHFLGRCCERLGRNGISIAPEAMRTLQQYDWPGNIRELRNVLERATVLAEDYNIRPSDIRFSSLSGEVEAAAAAAAPSDSFEPISLEQVEKRHIELMLGWTKGKKREAARLLGINRSTLDRKLDRYGIQAAAKDSVQDRG